MWQKFLHVLFCLVCFPLYAHNLMIVGDSMSEGYGAGNLKNWVGLLAERLDESWQVINLSKSGDTTSQGLVKLAPALFYYRPQIVLIELGGNDGVKGLTSQQIAANLHYMISLCEISGAKIMVLKGKLPANYEKEDAEIQKAYEQIRRTKQNVLVIDFMRGVSDNPKLMHSDNIHPNYEAQRLLLNNLWLKLYPLLKE